jgi:hypothetical protein
MGVKPRRGRCIVVTPDPLEMVDLLRRAENFAQFVTQHHDPIEHGVDAFLAETWLSDWAAMLATIDGPGARWVAVDVPEMVVCDHAGKHPHCDGCYVLLPHVRSEDCGLRKCDFSAVPVQCVPVTP